MLVEIAEEELMSIPIRHSAGMNEHKGKEKLHNFCSRRYKKPEEFSFSKKRYLFVDLKFKKKNFHSYHTKLLNPFAKG